ncbi:glutaredoxin family protein [Reinekea sp.]|uniref:glutaredoxin family protein n=1 Tax=Reinekea sp. TaxID=1970455 RepID=UPI002A7EE926|nr:glutaredoxin family protein [Reinekea sp.]
MRLFIYHTLGCHLCELAEAAVQQVLDAAPYAEVIRLEKVDIAFDEQLLARYGETIPVIKLEHSLDALYWPFVPATVAAYLNTHSPD